jgi:hypothetical protein
MATRPLPPGTHCLHRYPAIQCKRVKGELLAIGICQGAAFLRKIAEGTDILEAGESRCRIVARDAEVREEVFGIDGAVHEYEFLTLWLALNQQNARKFYDLSGKPARDAFMQKILLANLNTLAKSLDAQPGEPITCSAKVRFKVERIERENVMVFLGKFSSNLRIPDYLGIGQSVSQGYGTVRAVHAPPVLPVPPADRHPDESG